MTAAAIFIDVECPTCRERPGGLCSKEECRRAVLPQLAKNIGWLKLMGEALVEQMTRQNAPLPTTEKTAVERIGRRNARKLARKGRGYFGLAKAILGR